MKSVNNTHSPWFHPIHLNEEELGYLRQLGNQLTPQDIGSQNV